MKDTERKIYIEERKNIPADKKAEAGKIICEKLIASEEYKKAASLFLYLNMKNEVPTAGIIKQAAADGKTVAVPVTLGNREMFFTEIKGSENMVRTKLGVYEPVRDRSSEIFPDEGTLLIVPGVAFDIMGHRMGYGGGYYDTYIEKYGVENTVALAFDIQLKDEIAHEQHDKIMKAIITEKRTVTAR